MNVLKITIPHDKVLAFDGPDPETGLLSIYVAEQDVPVGLFASAVLKRVPLRQAEPDADVAIAAFKAVEHVERRAHLRVGMLGLYVDHH